MCVHQLFVPQTFLNKTVHTPVQSAGCYLCHSVIHKYSLVNMYANYMYISSALQTFHLSWESFTKLPC